MFAAFLVLHCPPLTLPNGKPITIIDGKYLGNDVCLAKAGKKVYEWAKTKGAIEHIHSTGLRLGLQEEDLYSPQSLGICTVYVRKAFSRRLSKALFYAGHLCRREG